MTLHVLAEKDVYVFFVCDAVMVSETTIITAGNLPDKCFIHYNLQNKANNNVHIVNKVKIQEHLIPNTHKCLFIITNLRKNKVAVAGGINTTNIW